jgi:hypothetical protein
MTIPHPNKCVNGEYLPLTDAEITELAERAVAAKAAELPEAKAAAVKQVNRDCGAFRASIATDIPFQSEVYAAKQAEAERYANDPTPKPADYPYIVAEAATTKMTVPQKVAEITAIAAQWVQVSAMVEAKRRGAIVAIDAAQSVADVEAAIPTNWP